MTLFTTFYMSFLVFGTYVMKYANGSIYICLQMRVCVCVYVCERERETYSVFEGTLFLELLCEIASVFGRVSQFKVCPAFNRL